MTQKTWVIPLDEEGKISFPEDLLKVMEWEGGTVLNWDVDADGVINLKRAYPHQESCLDKPQQQDET